MGFSEGKLKKKKFKTHHVHIDLLDDTARLALFNANNETLHFLGIFSDW